MHNCFTIAMFSDLSISRKYKCLVSHVSFVHYLYFNDIFFITEKVLTQLSSLFCILFSL